MSHPLLTGSPEERAAVIAALAGRATLPSNEELEALRDCLGDPRKLIQRRAAEAFAALAARGAAVEDRVRAALGAGNLSLRWGAAYTLAAMGRLPLDALPTLLDVIGSDDGDLRWAAADLLKRLAVTGRAAVIPPLLAAASGPGPARKMALYCLRDLAVAEAAHLALGALRDDNLEVRLAALALIAKVHGNPTAAAERVASLVDDPDPRMQRAAAATLGSLRVPSSAAIAALRRAEASADSSLRRAAIRSLRELGIDP